ncbi:hypothetical protein EDD29_0737 [Actinocorallia herbida]|uniref:Uncharacterized protein n=1 Tax=Actinocorallia herbida TaxID=58109 RepID=A0A3N1CPL6_9ACTN|nr:hypothetical protein [Actinocorallia herbida]ROO83242.1 hypothetical protein EDD29_0737 [Actinocorallia herbida]
MQTRWLVPPVLAALTAVFFYGRHWAAGPYPEGVTFQGTTRPDRVALTDFVDALRARDTARLKSLDDTSPEATGQDINAAAVYLVAEYSRLPGPVTITVTHPSPTSDSMTACLHFPPDRDLQFAGTTGRFPGSSSLYFADAHHFADDLGPSDAPACPAV